MSLTQSIDIKLFINLAGVKWAAICPLRLTKAGKQFDVNALCKHNRFICYAICRYAENEVYLSIKMDI